MKGNKLLWMFVILAVLGLVLGLHGAWYNGTLAVWIDSTTHSVILIILAVIVVLYGILLVMALAGVWKPKGKTKKIFFLG